MDIQYLLWLQRFRDATDGVLNHFFVQISDFSYGVFIWTLACVLFWSVNKKNGAFLFLNIAASRFLMQFLKLTFCVYRPWVRMAEIVPVEKASGYSFPSGHAVTASSNYGFIMIRYGKKHWPLGVFMAIMILLTMFSRNYIGVHTPQDVIVGAILGLTMVFLGTKAWEWIEQDPRRDRIIPCMGVIFTALFLVYISVKSYPMHYAADGNLLVDPAKMMKDGYKDAGRFLGVALGWFLERRYVRFSMEAPVLQKITRASVGFLLILLYETVLTPAVTSALKLPWIGFVLSFAELMLLMVIYPFCFSRIEGKREALPAN